MDLERFIFTQINKCEPEQSYHFVFNENKILIRSGTRQLAPLTRDAWLSLELSHLPNHYFGSLENIPCYAVTHTENNIDEQFEWIEMRRVLVESNNDLFAIAGRGKQVLEFKRTHQFCGICGGPTQEHHTELALECRHCAINYYPRLSPCIIVLVTRGEELLLAHGARLPEGLYTTLAGFVEAGETLEQCIHREVFEEVGLKVNNIAYYSSQAWPFPHQLMTGFFANYASGDIKIDGKEILDARWWHYKDLPRVPPKGAIANSLIYDYVHRLQKKT